MQKSECRKFIPNIFNKNKCAACFKAKEEHSDEALENNRASRKVAKCGYLFAAPDWDFSDPINRTKRWQRRWFVLYDDGELTYSVDEHPETVPQAIIDMNRVMEVSEAEEVTGHPFSLALTAPDRVHFLKGTSREESKWWFDILSMFPRTNMKTGRHKRNATFPGSKATTIINPPQQQNQPIQQSSTPNSPCMSKGVSIQPFQTPPMSRPRFHSHTESSSGTCLNNTFNLLPVKDTNGRKSSKMVIDEDDIIPVKQEPSAVTATSKNTTATTAADSATTNDKDVIIMATTDNMAAADEKFKTRRVIRREIRGARSARSNSEILSSMLTMNNPPLLDLNEPTKSYALVLPGSTLTAPIGSLKNNNDRPRSSLLLPPIPPPTTTSSTTTTSTIQQQQQHSPFYLYMADSPTTKTRHYESLDNLQHNQDRLSDASRARHSSSKDVPDALLIKDRPTSLHELAGMTTSTVSRSSSSSSSSSRFRSSTPQNPLTPSRSVISGSIPDSTRETVRGDPDGCGLDPVTSFCSPLPDRKLRSSIASALSAAAGGVGGSDRGSAGVSPSSSTSSSTFFLDDGFKKGWILRLSYGGEWKKYWFVLRCSAATSGVATTVSQSTLSLYRDHAAEETGLMPEDVIDLSKVTSVDETDTGRSYGFQVTETTSGGEGFKRHSLAALTSGIRSQWIQALRNACNQAMKSHGSNKSLAAEKENVDPGSIPMAPRNPPPAEVEAVEDSFELLEETDEEDEGSDDSEDEGSDTAGEETDPDVTLSSIPISPPVNRTPMSLVKERDRSRSSSRSRSSRQRCDSNSPSSTRMAVSPVQTEASSPVPGQFQMRLDAAKGEISRLLNERRDQEREAQKQLIQLNQRVAEKEKQIANLTASLESSKAEYQRQLNDFKNCLEAKEIELSALRQDSEKWQSESSELRENLKRERSEVYKLRDVAQELRSLLDSRNDTLNELQSKSDEVDNLNKRLKSTQESLNRTQERLQRGIDENEGLCARLRQMEENQIDPHLQNSADKISGLRRSRSSTGSMPLPLHLCSRNLLGGSSRKSLARLDSLSDLSNIDYEMDLDGMDHSGLVDEYLALRARFERSLTEIRALKKELRSTQSALDGFEVAQLSLKQQWAVKESDYASQLNLMAARIQDLTSKMGSSDKQVRQLKVKVAKSESREKRRTQSLKGRESFQLSKDVEEKLVDLENKMAALGAGSANPTSTTPSADRESPPSRIRKGFEEPTKSFKMRRKSLEGGAAAAAASTSSTASSDPLKILLRVDQLEQQVKQSSGGSPPRKTTSGIPTSIPERKGSSLPARSSAQGRPPRSSPIRSGIPTPTNNSGIRKSSPPSTPSTTVSPTNPVKSSKMAQDLEQCIVELELLIKGKSEPACSGLVVKMRSIQRDLLGDPSSGSIPQVDKIQELLKVRLSELKVKRDHVRSLGKLDSAAVSQIAAEKLALELAIAEQLANSNPTNPNPSKDSLRDAHWTIQKLGWLRRKLSGEKSAPALEQSTSFGTYCAALAERLSALAALSSNPEGSGCSPVIQLPAGIAQQLTEEERELSILFAQYKEEKLAELAELLAHETLRMGDSQQPTNQLVEEVKIRQAWLEAQELANKELVDSEVRQAMTRMAEVFAEDVSAEERLASALLLWPVQQVQYEQRCQVVEEVLRSEMEEAVLQLSNAYESALKRMKAETGSNIPEGDLEAVLSEFAEVVAHKALIDGHIAVLQGESPCAPLAVPTGNTTSGGMEESIGIIQETESIIGLSSSAEEFFPAALNCAEVAAILHRNLVESNPARSGNGNNPQEESIRQKYQDEIEQLRALTEKGMSAMEGSHKRIIAQMEEKHQQDLARLQVEKERALAEETQATLAALDAMRKAHEAEVQREIARFKEEFLAQMSSSSSTTSSSSSSRNTNGSNPADREREIEEIRHEILSLSEKYSHKCLETAALEQKVSSLSQQVSVSHRQIGDLDARNQQLRSFLESNLNQDQTELNPAEQLRAKDSQLLMLQEDVAELQFVLRESQSREEELGNLARSLGQYLKTDRPLQPEQVAALRHRLEDFLLVSSPQGRKSSTVLLLPPESPSTPGPNSSSGRFHYARKDLTRSPSCPRLSAGFLSLAPRLSSAARPQPPN